MKYAVLPNGDLITQQSLCRQCRGSGIWECDLDGQLYCVQCDPPLKVVPKIIEEKKLAAAAKAANARKLEDEMEEDNERLLFTERTGKTS